MAEVTEFFRDAVGGGAGSFCSIECTCGRVHFVDPEISKGDWEEGEAEELLRRHAKEPDRWVMRSDDDAVHSTEVFGRVYVEDCACDGLSTVERALWGNREWIAEYLATRAQAQGEELLSVAERLRQMGIDSKVLGGLRSAASRTEDFWKTIDALPPQSAAYAVACMLQEVGDRVLPRLLRMATQAGNLLNAGDGK